MNLTSVKSGNVAAIGYDPAKRELHVRFHSGPTVYTYPDVSPQQHQALMNAPSKGGHIAKHFRKPKA